jgi:enoyl-[acyl-carrier protein] reductase I
MGLLDGRTALIFGVANDHSIAWGIAQALHAEGAEVGFSSIESLIDKRVRPLADSLGSTFVEPCDVQSDEDIARVFARWGERHDSLDILVHALAFAKREDLSGSRTRPVTASRWRWTCRPIRWSRSRGRPGRTCAGGHRS